MKRVFIDVDGFICWPKVLFLPLLSKSGLLFKPLFCEFAFWASVKMRCINLLRFPFFLQNDTCLKHLQVAKQKYAYLKHQRQGILFIILFFLFFFNFFFVGQAKHQNWINAPHSFSLSFSLSLSLFFSFSLNENDAAFLSPVKFVLKSI